MATKAQGRGSAPSTRRRALGAAAALAVLVAGVGAGTGAVGSEGEELAPQATGTAVTWWGDLAGQAPCPEGMTRSATLGGTHFEPGVPQSRFNNGWAHSTTGIAGRAARSAVSSSDTRDSFFLDWVQGPVGARTMVALASRGTVPSSSLSRFQVNSVDLRVAANSSSWSGKVYDVTAATDDESGRLGGWLEHTSSAGASAWWEVDNVQYYTCRNAPVGRIAGADRYATSAQVARAFPAGLPTAYLVSGSDFPDALAAGALAGRDAAPVLLTKTDSLPRTVATELQRLQPGRIVVLGDQSSVSDAAAQAAAAYSTSGTVERVAGANRYATAAAASATYPVGVPVAYVATGQDFPDALSGSARAGLADAPLLLVRGDLVPGVVTTELERLRPGRIVVLGGPPSVSDAVVEQLRGLTTSGQVQRLAGPDRYATSAAVAQTFPAGAPAVYVATGTKFPDALSGAALAARRGAPVLLTRPQGLPSVVAAEISDQDAAEGVVLGGQPSVHALVLDQLGGRVG